MSILGNSNYVLANLGQTLPHNYVNPANPTTHINPRMVNMTWLNVTSGEVFTCVDNAPNANVWEGESGTYIGLIYKLPYRNNVFVGDFIGLDDGSIPEERFWNFDYDSNTRLRINNYALIMTTIQENIIINLGLELVGDFVITSLLELRKSTNAGDTYCFLIFPDSDTGEYLRLGIRCDDTSPEAYVRTSSANTSYSFDSKFMKIKITKVGNTLTGYYMKDGYWQVNGNSSGLSVTITTSVIPSLKIETYTTNEKQIGIHNIIIHSADSIIWG